MNIDQMQKDIEEIFLKHKEDPINKDLSNDEIYRKAMKEVLEKKIIDPIKLMSENKDFISSLMQELDIQNTSTDKFVVVEKTEIDPSIVLICFNKPVLSVNRFDILDIIKELRIIYEELDSLPRGGADAK